MSKWNFSSLNLLILGYARRYVHPRLSPEAATQLQEFYLELRRQRQTGDCTPITTRQLESLIRLTEVNRISVMNIIHSSISMGLEQVSSI